MSKLTGKMQLPIWLQLFILMMAALIAVNTVFFFLTDSMVKSRFSQYIGQLRELSATELTTLTRQVLDIFPPQELRNSFPWTLINHPQLMELTIRDRRTGETYFMYQKIMIRNNPPPGPPFPIPPPIDSVERTFDYDAKTGYSYSVSFKIHPMQSTIFLQIIRKGLIALFFSLVVILLAISFFISRTITSPLKKLIRGSADIASGKYGISFEEEGSIETASLIRAFNRLSNQLRIDDEFRQRYTSDISHEILTPVSTLKSYLYALRDGVMPMSDETVRDMEEEFSRLETLIADLKDLERVSTKDQRNKSEISDLSTFVRQTGKKYSVGCPQDSFLSMDISDGIQAKFVRKDIVSLVQNLLNNGFFHNDKREKTVRLTLRDTEEGIELSVSDNGVGIPEKELTRIFDRFYRVDPSRSTKTGGRGLGLSIVKEIADANGWVIKVQSEPGKGSTFTILLPHAAATSS